MNISQLRTLLSVVEEGSFSGAARRMGLSQSGVSRQLQRLEAEVGAPLLARTGTGIAMLTEGGRVLEFARHTVAQYDRLISGAAGAPLRGALRIIASTTPGEYLAPGLASAFKERYPEVSAEIFVADSAIVAEELLEKRWDVGFVGITTGGSRLTNVPMAQDEIVLAVPARHRLAENPVAPLAALEGERFIGREVGSGTQRTVLAAIEAHGRQMPDHSVAMIVGSTHGVVSAVDTGLGIGFVSARALERHDPARVKAVRLMGLPITRSLHLVYEEGRARPRHVQAFIDFAVRERNTRRSE